MNKEEFNAYCDKVDQELDQKERLQNPNALSEEAAILTYIIVVGAIITIIILTVCVF
jgi:DNA-binding transcriptional regulator/RsmH inhibitor MraZ